MLQVTVIKKKKEEGEDVRKEDELKWSERGVKSKAECFLRCGVGVPSSPAP